MVNLVRFSFLSVVVLLAGNVYAADDAVDVAKEPSVAGLEEGLISFEKGDFSTVFHMRIQGWGGWTGASSDLGNGDAMQEPGFMLRRARFGFDGQFMPEVTYILEMDLFDQERTGGPLYSAWMAWNPSPWFGSVLGVQHFPFLKGEMMSSSLLPHLDRAVGTDAMSPENSMGLTLKSELWEDHLSLTVGVFNGLRRTSTFYGGYEGVGISLGNRFEEMAYAGGLDFEPMDPIGDGMADLTKGDAFRLALGGAAFYNDGSSIQTMGYAGYLHAKMAGVHLFAEFAQDKAEPQAKPTTTSTIQASVERRVINASLGYVILKNRLGVAVRGELIDDNVDMDSQGDEWLVNGTFTWYIMGDFLKAQVEYTHREELHGISIANDSYIGGFQLLF